MSWYPYIINLHDYTSLHENSIVNLIEAFNQTCDVHLLDYIFPINKRINQKNTQSIKYNLKHIMCSRCDAYHEFVITLEFVLYQPDERGSYGRGLT